MIALLIAAVSLAAPFRDGCVLQRNRPVAVWGTAASGEEVRVRFAGQDVRTAADRDGRWKVTLSPMAVSRVKSGVSCPESRAAMQTAAR